MRRKKTEEASGRDRWLVSYADFITLLFAFFVVMYAISQADIVKFQQVSESMRKAFEGGPTGIPEEKGMRGGNSINLLDHQIPSYGRMADMPPGRTNTAADFDPELQNIKEMLEESISLDVGVSDLADKYHVEYDSQGLIIRLAVKGFYDPGQVSVHPDLRPLLDRIARILRKSDRMIRIEGHTDLMEAKFKDAERNGLESSWDLAAARSSWLVRDWVERFKFPPGQLGVAGFSHYRPLSLGMTKFDLARNRRLEIIIRNQKFVPIRDK